MLDRWTHAIVQPPLRLLACCLPRSVTPDRVSLIGFATGMLVVPVLFCQWYQLALVLVLANRVLDGLDGALARRRGGSDAGGFLDITLDFIFYPAVVVGFILANPSENAVPGAVLLFSFMGATSSFLAFAVMSEKYGIKRAQFASKALHYSSGLAEGTETILFFAAMCLFPGYFSALAWLFSCLCLVTTATRLYGGYQQIREAEAH